MEMKYKLLHIFKEEMLLESKRLVPLVYDEEDIMNCDFNKLHKLYNPKYEEFKIEFEMITPHLCILKNKGDDYLNEKHNYKKIIAHNKKYINYRKEDYDLYETAKIIADDIIQNKKKYNEESLFTLIPKLCKKYIKAHHDSVDWECIIMLLEEKLFINGYLLKSTNICNLEKMG